MSGINVKKVYSDDIQENRLCEVIIFYVYYISMYFLFNKNYDSVPILLACFIFISVAVCLNCLKGKYKYICYTACFILTALFVAVFNRWFINGFADCYNYIADLYGSANSCIVDKLKIDAQLNMTFSRIIFNLVLVNVSMFIADIIIHQNMVIFSFGMWIATFSIACYLKEPKLFFVSFLLMVVWLFMLYRGYGLKYNFIINYKAITTAMALSIVLAMALCFTNGDLKINVINDITDNIRYGNSILPQGDFKKVSAFNCDSSEKDVMNVVMSEPYSCYMRGYVGSEYTKYGWEELDNNTLYNYNEVFYWLKENELNSNSILSNLSNTEDNNRVIINNKAESKKYIYTPYELCRSNEITDYNIISENIISKGFNGQNSYTYNMINNTMKNRNELFSKCDNDNYIYAEGLYRDFAHKVYVAVPDDVKAVISSLLGEYDKNKISYMVAKQNILNALKEFEYSTDIAYNDIDTDFVSYFLQNSHSGNSMQFSSSAVLMLRYYNIPARYREGYIITPNDIKDVGKNQEIKLTKKNAHAWAEYYEDGKGWIPFEVTPTYIGLIETDSIYTVTDNEEQQSPDETNTESSTETKDNIKNENPQEQGDYKVNIIIYVIVGAILIIAIFLLVKKLIQYIRLKNSFNDIDNNVAVENIFNHSTEILLKCGLILSREDIYYSSNVFVSISDNDNNKEFVYNYKTAFSIFEKAKFSQHKISQDEKAFMYGFMLNCKKQAKLLKQQATEKEKQK